MKSILIPKRVSSILESAFEGCHSLSEIVIPDKVIRIGNAVFKDCSSLHCITIPDSVEQIEKDAFVGCKSLKKIKASRETFEKFKDYFPLKARLFSKLRLFGS